MVVSIDRKGNILSVRPDPEAKAVDFTELVRLLAERIIEQNRKGGSAELSA